MRKLLVLSLLAGTFSPLMAEGNKNDSNIDLCTIVRTPVEMVDCIEMSLKNTNRVFKDEQYFENCLPSKGNTAKAYLACLGEATARASCDATLPSLKVDSNLLGKQLEKYLLAIDKGRDNPSELTGRYKGTTLIDFQNTYRSVSLYERMALNINQCPEKYQHLVES